MHKNHRRGYVDPGAHSHGWRTCILKPTKEDARVGYRTAARQLLHRILVNDLDPDAALFPTRNVEVSDTWKYD